MINGSALANEPEHAAEHESGHGGKSAVTLFLGGTEVHDVWEPTLGLEYTYHINHLWGVFGLVERSDREQDTTLVIAGLGLHPYKELVLIAGVGKKDPADKLENVLRIGAAYEIPLGNGWGVEPYVGLDFIENHDDNELVLGVYIGRRF